MSRVDNKLTPRYTIEFSSTTITNPKICLLQNCAYVQASTIGTKKGTCWPQIYATHPGASAQETGGGQDLSKGHQRYDFDVIPLLNIFHENELFNGA